MSPPVDPPAKSGDAKPKTSRRRAPPVLSLVPSAEAADAGGAAVVKTAAAIVEAVAEAPAILSSAPPPVLEAPAPVVVPEASAIVPPLPLSLRPSMVNPMTTSFAGYQEITAIGQANLDALIQANSILTKGIEEFSKEFLSLTKASLESAAAASTAILAAKSLKDVVALNADFTKAQYESMLANSTKLGELSVKVATDSVAPIKARFETAIEKAKAVAV
jgi:phasin family protein